MGTRPSERPTSYLLGLLSEEARNAASEAVDEAGFECVRVRRAVEAALASGARDNT